MPTRTMGFVRLVMDSIANPIMHVLTGSSPTKVGEIIVRRIVIEVKAIHAFRTRTDESLQHQMMDVATMLYLVSSQTNTKMSARPSGPQFLLNNGVRLAI